MMRRHGTRVMPAGLALLLLTACGSTASTNGGSGGAALQNNGGQAGLGAAPGSTAGSGLGGATGTANGGTTGTAGGGTLPGTTGGTATGGTTGSVSSTTGGFGGTTGGTTGGAVANGPGVTATTIALGIPYCSDCAAANGALGADGEDPGDTRRYFQAALDEVNNRGGVLGRKLVPVYHQISASDSVDVSAQAMCETFTKDNKVAAIFFRTQIIDECAKKAGIIAVSDSGSGRLFAQYPNLFSPSTIRFEGLAAATVKGMLAAGWQKPTTKWPTGKIGLITWDDNEYKYAVAHGWQPALQSAGLKADVKYVAIPQSDKSLADSSSAIASAVLSFRDQGIDHVFIADGAAGVFRGGGLTLQFLDEAKSQQYFPRYGFNTNNAPGDSALPADEQSGMLAVDANDLMASNDQGIAPNPQRTRCYAVMQKKGLKTTDGKATGLTALEACDTAWFAEAIFSHSRSFVLADVIAGGESLGTSFRSPYAFGTRLGPGRHDGLTFFRNSRFDDACACMKYTSKPYEP
ncbi:MAG: hypothetical protein QOJ79_2839 [Actinomycetota bacterium]|nr:hypothetical protein [Actinomycetota bacterium]